MEQTTQQIKEWNKQQPKIEVNEDQGGQTYITTTCPACGNKNKDYWRLADAIDNDGLEAMRWAEISDKCANCHKVYGIKLNITLTPEAYLEK